MTGREDYVQIEGNVSLAHTAVLEPFDATGVAHPIRIAAGCRVGSGAILYGGTVLGEGVVVEDYAIVGKPEFGYAIGERYLGTAESCVIGAGTIIRAGAHVYSGAELGPIVHVGHYTVLRSGVKIGEGTQLAHHICIERGCSLGRNVRSSPHTHLTGKTIAHDRVFFGAAVKTVNDRSMIWRAQTTPVLKPPRFDTGAAIGSGSTIAAGVRIGEWALIGSHSLVLQDVPAGSIAYGVPAILKGRRLHPDDLAYIRSDSE